MIKKLHEITLRDVILLDATKSARPLIKYWFIPIWFFRTELEQLAGSIFKAIGGDTLNDVEDEMERLTSYRRLQLLEALYKALTIEISLKAKINAWKLIINQTMAEAKYLEEIIEKIKEHTGIVIASPRDLKIFEDYVQNKIDKFKQTYPEKDKSDAASVQEVIYSVFNYMGETYNESMPLNAFVTMKQMAEKKIKSTPKTTEDGQYE